MKYNFEDLANPNFVPKVDNTVVEKKNMVKLDDENTLLCPACNFHYLHHCEIEIFEREEDEEKGLHITVKNRQANIQCDNLKDNPSSRRDGLIIKFWCEGCNNKSILKLSQHKGQTILEWE